MLLRCPSPGIQKARQARITSALTECDHAVPLVGAKMKARNQIWVTISPARPVDPWFYLWTKIQNTRKGHVVRGSKPPSLPPPFISLSISMACLNYGMVWLLRQNSRQPGSTLAELAAHPQALLSSNSGIVEILVQTGKGNLCRKEEERKGGRKPSACSSQPCEVESQYNGISFLLHMKQMCRLTSDSEPKSPSSQLL